MRRLAAILFVLLAIPGLCGCGQKGPLKLPPETPRALVTADAS